MMNLRLVKKYFVCFLKKKSTDKKVAVLRKISKVRDGWSLKKYWVRFRWPDEEMGRNSAIPWIMAKTML